ncbi:MAG: hypothetical protein M0Z83_01265 [Betaproteobacteria bacterium]|nr:hypothetical protein [Betaproteobacteria bacterium]
MLLRTIALSAGCALLSATALADTSDIKAANNQVGIQWTSTNVNYTETGNGVLGANGATLDTEGGSVSGYAISASVMKDLLLGNDYFSLEYNHASGSTNYVGASLTGGGVYGSLTASSGATLINYSARYGKGFTNQNMPNVMVTPYVELGHHEWDRGVNTGETYTNSYYGAGLLGQYSPIPKLVLSGNALIGETFGSNITANAIPNLIPAFNGFSGGLGNSALYKVGVSADYAFTQNFHGNVGVDYTSFDYGASAIYSGYGEPNSTTAYTVARVGIGYAF